MDFKAGDLIQVLPGFRRAGDITRLISVHPEIDCVMIYADVLLFSYKIVKIDINTVTKLERIIYGVENERIKP